MHSVEIRNRLRTVHDCIVQKKDKLILALTKHESYKTAISEVEKCLTCLADSDKQLQYLSKSALVSLCAFLPLNQPLYSLILFVVIPGCRFQEVYFRPPVLLADTYQELFSLLNLSNWNISCETISRRNFIFERARKADCVIYTGKYNNAVEVKQQLPSKAVFIFQGSAANPIIVSKEAVIADSVINKIVKAQTYNSGQDCMAPSVIFVHSSHRVTFLKMLIKRVRALIVGDYSDKAVDISSLIEDETLFKTEELLKSPKTKLLFGGKINKESKIVYPSIIEYDQLCDLPIESSFAPVFSLYSYNEDQEVINYLSRNDCQENKAYVTVFGRFGPWDRDEIIIQDDILDSVDDGNNEFGGYGRHSGFVSYDGLVVSKPILISKELALFSKQNNIVVPEGNMDNPIFESYIALSLVDFYHKRIMEIGCGLLPHAQFLAPHCTEYHAIDANNDKLSLYSDQIRSPKIHVYNMNAIETSFNDKSFSAVLMFHCLHEAELNEQGKILSEVRRILDNDGLLLIIDPIPERTTQFQKCFDFVHESIANYKHVFGVQHADWIVKEFIRRGLFLELYNHRFSMNYYFSSIDSLINAIIESFRYELKWTDNHIIYLRQALISQFGIREEYNLEEEVTVKLLKNTTAIHSLNDDCAEYKNVSEEAVFL